MSFLSKLFTFILSLFGYKKTTTVEPSDPVDDTEVSETPVTEEGTVVEEEPKEEAMTSEEAFNTYFIKPFDDGDKDTISNILRPIIKNLNSDDLYVSLCTSLCESKILKTYATLSEDKMTLTINLSRNKIFNELLSSFIADHVVSLFQASIDAEYFGQYIVTASDGSIIIRKLD